MNSPRKQLGLTMTWLLGIVVIWFVAASGDVIRKLACITLLAYVAAWSGYFVFSKLSRRQFLIRFMVTTISIGLSLAAVELTVAFGLIDFRVVLRQPLEPWENPNNLFDEELIHLHRPHFHAKGRIEGGDLVAFANAPPLTINEFDFHYDHNGFRNPKDLDKSDVVVVGDSFVEGANVKDEQLLTTVIAQQLGCTVSNLGQAHYGPQQELIVLRRYGMQLRPKVCVWLFFEGNDLGDISRYDSLLADKRANPKTSWKERSFLLNSLFFVNSRLNATPQSSSKRQSGVLDNRDKTRLWFGYPGRGLSQSQLTALDRLMDILKEAQQTCEANHCKLLVVFAPSKYRVYSNHCTPAENSPIHNWIINDLPDRMKVGVGAISPAPTYLDLTNDFQTAASGDELLYYPDDTHWTPRGHELAGSSISNTIRTHFARYLTQQANESKKNEP